MEPETENAAVCLHFQSAKGKKLGTKGKSVSPEATKANPRTNSKFEKIVGGKTFLYSLPQQSKVFSPQNSQKL